MREREMQAYLYENPEVLFPGGRVESRNLEYSVQGKRIDLLFTVDGVRHIVELKAVPIKREHVGQVVEYYGLMREAFPEEEFRLTLVAPRIPSWRVAYLEEVGIRCVEINEIPSSFEANLSVEKKVRRATKTWDQRSELERELAPGDRFFPSDICAEATPRKLSLILKVVGDSLPALSKAFAEYEIQPLRMTRAGSNHFFREYDEVTGYGDTEYERAGWWWAFTLGFQEEMPPNDVPQLAVSANNFGLDIAVNAELLPAQAVLVEKVKQRRATFDRLVHANGNLVLKTYLRFEQQPRAYHWILADYSQPGSFDSTDILKAYSERRREFSQIRENWINHIQENNLQLTEKQISHLRSRNKKLNLATRLVHVLPPEHPVWTKNLPDQVTGICDAMVGLKPLVDFFLS